MRDFSKISPALWQSDRFNNLPSDDGRYLYLYFLTSRHQTSAGAYQLPDGYACTDLRWELERYVKARKELADADLLRFDQDTSVLMITRWFRHNPPMNDRHLIGMERIIDQLPSSTIREATMEALREACEEIEAKRAAKDARRGAGAGRAPNGLGGNISKLETNYLNGRAGR